MSFIKINAFGETNVGLVRKNNEDYLTYFESGSAEVTETFGRLYIVADGVGGAATGEVASKYAALKVLHTYFSQPGLNPWQRIKVGMKHANEALVTYIRQNAQARMATTMTAAAVNGDQMTVVNVGDSRAYVLRNGAIKQITQDHNLVNEMIRNGVLTEEQAKTAKVKNQLTSSLGGHEVFKADVFMETLLPGDRVLLCSDGFCRYAEDPAIVKKFLQTGTPEQVVNNCIQYARNSGGQDNITVMVLDIGEILPEAVDSYDRGARPDPVDLREVVSNPMTLDARSPSQETKMKNGDVEGTTQMVGLFKPDLTVPAIPAREAYAVPGINMAADDSDLMDTDNLGEKNGTNLESTSSTLLDEESGQVSVTSAQLRTVASQRLTSQAPPQTPPESVKDPSTGTLSILVIFSSIIVVILLGLAVFLGLRYLQMRRDQNQAAVPTPVIVTEVEDNQPEEVVALEPTQTEAQQVEEPTIEPTLEPTEETVEELASETGQVLLGECLYQVQMGDTISQIIEDQFFGDYDEAAEYEMRVCENNTDPIQCEDPVVISNHNAINPGEYLVIPDVDRTICGDRNGVWYTNLNQ